MTLTLEQIWRYPIKAIGAEQLDEVAVTQGHPLPLDRAWAVLEQGGDASEGWRSCRNFLRGAKGPSLMAVTARTEGTSITLTHFDRPDLTLTPGETPVDVLLDWLAPIYPETRAPGIELVKAPEEGLADVSFASVSLMGLSSLRALSQKAGRDLGVRRFRGNLWLDGLAPWEEFDLIGKTLQIGDARLEVLEPITRCRATEANPDTGIRDTNTLKVLEDGWGHTEFGVNARVIQSGTMRVKDTVTLL